MPPLHQFIPTAAAGDALSDHAFLLRGWLRALGFTSDIFAEHIAPELRGEARPLKSYRPPSTETPVIYHHGLGSRVVDFLLATPARLILVYHNVTPPEFFHRWHPGFVRDLETGRAQLRAMRERTELALGASPYSEAELHALGFARTGVLPITLDERQYRAGPASPARDPSAGPRLLSVGRLVPSKRAEDLLKLLHCYRRVEPRARLWLVGQVPVWLPNYDAWLEEIVIGLGLREAVEFVGHVSQAELVARYQRADVYISMSEHEGFGKPLAESMYLGLPVLAFAAAAVPDTLGGAGVLFHAKHYEALVEMIEIIREDAALRQRLIARQRERVRMFSPEQVRPLWNRFLADLRLIPETRPA